MKNLKLAGFADEAAPDIAGQIRAIKTLGWDSIELRTVDRKPFLNLSDADFEKTSDALEAAGISICCLGSGIANWEADVNADFNDTKKMVTLAVKRMKRLKTSFVRIMSYKVIQDSQGRMVQNQLEKERIRRLNWVCSTFTDNGLTAVHENCHTWGGLSYEHTLRLLDAVPALKLVFDTGNPPLTIDARTAFPHKMQDAMEFFRQVREFIVHIHIKDAIMNSGNKTEHYTFPAEGNGYVREITTVLEKSGYSGYYSIEPHMEVVFHNSAVQSSEQKRFDNFVEYGRRFEKILKETWQAT